MKYVFIISMLLISCFSLTAKTIRAGKDRVYKSIQQAISLSENGDTVLVDPGIYKEKNIVIGKSIVLKGLNYPVLDGENKFEIVSIKASKVTVDGFRIVHCGVSSLEDYAGIKIYNKRDVVIQNNILEDTFFGIYAQQGTNCVIQNNSLTSYSKLEQQSGNGIHCWKSDSMRISDNQISGHRDGIYFEFVTNSIIELGMERPKPGLLNLSI